MVTTLFSSPRQRNTHPRIPPFRKNQKRERMGHPAEKTENDGERWKSGSLEPRTGA